MIDLLKMWTGYLLLRLLWFVAVLSGYVTWWALRGRNYTVLWISRCESLTAEQRRKLGVTLHRW